MKASLLFKLAYEAVMTAGKNPFRAISKVPSSVLLGEKHPNAGYSDNQVLKY